MAKKAGLKTKFPSEYQSVILISVDALRFDAPGYEGDDFYLRPLGLHNFRKTPQLDRLAQGGFAFSGCRSQAPVTTPSHSSMLTGRLPANHGVSRFMADAMFNDCPTLFSLAKSRGFRPITGIDFLSGFDLAGITKDVEPKLRLSVDAALDAAATVKSRGEKSLVFLHLNDVHDPYGFNKQLDYQKDRILSRFYRGVFKKCGLKFDPNRFWKPLQEKILEDNLSLLPLAIYLHGVNHFDQWRLKSILSRLRKNHLLENSLVVITSDHGEGAVPSQFLWKNQSRTKEGHFGHTIGLNEEIIRVPLLFWDGGARVQVGKYADPVSSVDIVPTILDLLNCPYKKQAFDGTSRAALLLGETNDRARTASLCYSETWRQGPSFLNQLTLFHKLVGRSQAGHFTEAGGFFDYEGLDQFCFRSGPYKWIERLDRTPLLFDTVEDPSESKNLAELIPLLELKEFRALPVFQKLRKHLPILRRTRSALCRTHNSSIKDRPHSRGRPAVSFRRQKKGQLLKQLEQLGYL